MENHGRVDKDRQKEEDKVMLILEKRLLVPVWSTLYLIANILNYALCERVLCISRFMEKSSP